MTWNHRLLFKDGVVMVIECHYDDQGRPEGYCPAEAVSDLTDHAKSIARQLRQMLQATKAPILTEDDFAGK